MAREKNKSQIIRFDGKNCFVEVMNSAFSIGKVQLNFREYDEKRQAGDRNTKEIDLYMDIDTFLLLANDIISGKLPKLAELEKEKAKKLSTPEKKAYPQTLDEYTDMGGMSVEGLKKSNATRKAKNRKTFSEMYKIPEGKCLSRQFKIMPGLSAPIMLKAECGIGEENETKLIVPKYGNKPEQMIQIPLQFKDLKKLALLVTAHVNAFISSQYVMEVTNPQSYSADNNKPA